MTKQLRIIWICIAINILTIPYWVVKAADSHERWVVTNIEQIKPSVRHTLRCEVLIEQRRCKAYEARKKLIGPTGPSGLVCGEGLDCENPHGPRGDTGPTGLQGKELRITERGERGETGPIGPRGFQGYGGPTGQTGAEGPTGPTGAITTNVTTPTIRTLTYIEPEIGQAKITSIEPYEPLNDGQGRYGSVTLHGEWLGDTASVTEYPEMCSWIGCFPSTTGIAAEHFKVEHIEGNFGPTGELVHVQLVPLNGQTVYISLQVHHENGPIWPTLSDRYTFPSFNSGPEL